MLHASFSCVTSLQGVAAGMAQMQKGILMGGYLKCAPWLCLSSSWKLDASRSADPPAVLISVAAKLLRALAQNGLTTSLSAHLLAACSLGSATGLEEALQQMYTSAHSPCCRWQYGEAGCVCVCWPHMWCLSRSTS